MPTVQKHFVTFYSPGTFVAETTQKPIGSWSVATAKRMAKDIKERYGARPYGFRFSTRSRGPNDLDSKVTAESGMYYIGCRVQTLEQIKARNDPKDHILISNMEGNGWRKVVSPKKGWGWAQPLLEGETVLP